ncbi:MAG: transposase [Bacteroidales bacterium]|nr:transposase [Candidatus Cryptobacteroides fimicaballi]
MQTPDFNTINLFRKNRLANVVDDLFTQVVQMLVGQKLISLDVQYVDGTKIEANASKYTFVWKKATQTSREKLDRKVKAILAEAPKERVSKISGWIFSERNLLYFNSVYIHPSI